MRLTNDPLSFPSAPSSRSLLGKIASSESALLIFIGNAVLFCLNHAGLTQTAFADQSHAPLVAEVERRIVERTNKYRKSNDLPAVTSDDALTTCAQEFAQFMAKNDLFGHQADDRTPGERAKAAGYDYCVIRENIAYRTDPGEVTAQGLTEVLMEGWIDSPPHQENLEAPYITQTGVGLATVDGVTFYAVHLFGRPKSAAISLTIRNESDNPRILAIAANESMDEVELNPRMTIKMSRCFPTTLSLVNEEVELTVTQSNEFKIDKEGKLTQIVRPSGKSE